MPATIAHAWHQWENVEIFSPNLPFCRIIKLFVDRISHICTFLATFILYELNYNLPWGKFTQFIQFSDPYGMFIFNRPESGFDMIFMKKITLIFLLNKFFGV